MTAFVLWAIRILVVMLVARYVLRAILRRSTAPARRRPAGPIERAGGALVRCAHCRTYVPETTALTVRRGSAADHFCSVTCRETWTETH